MMKKLRLKMNKNALFIVGILTMFLIAACSPSEQPAPQPQVPAETPQITETGEANIDEVGSGLEDIDGLEEDLDDSGLDDLDSVFGDIENI
jgi:hypothetical protein